MLCVATNLAKNNAASRASAPTTLIWEGGRRKPLSPLSLLTRYDRPSQRQSSNKLHNFLPQLNSEADDPSLGGPPVINATRRLVKRRRPLAGIPFQPLPHSISQLLEHGLVVGWFIGEPVGAEDELAEAVKIDCCGEVGEGLGKFDESAGLWFRRGRGPSVVVKESTNG
jgi:hypothetical protein